MRVKALALLMVLSACKPSAEQYIDKCLSSASVLNDLEKITFDVSSALTTLGITHWLDSGTLVGAYRFSAPLPFDDDVDLGLMRDDYLKQRHKLPEMLDKVGYRIAGWDGDPRRDSIPQVFFKDDGGRPHLDFFIFEPYAEKADYLRLSSESWHHTAKYGDGLGFPKASIFDKAGKLGTGKFVGREYKTPIDIAWYLRSWYPESSILYSFVMTQTHSDDKLCGEKVTIKDIRKRPAVLEKLFAHLESVFGSRYRRTDSRLY